MKKQKINSCIGALMGLAVGDAVGTTHEFVPRDDVIKTDDMVGGGHFQLKPGQWTDDTSMALCLAYSLVTEPEFSLEHQAHMYLAWWKNGYMSCTGTCFDIGSTVADALTVFNETGVLSDQAHERSAGNGSIMRLAPAVIKHVDNKEDAIKYAMLQSTVTHSDPEVLDCCEYLAHILWLTINNQDMTKEELIKTNQVFRTEKVQELSTQMWEMKYEDVGSRGYVVTTLEFAIWCFLHTNDFKSCVLMAANGGGDADTNAAVAGQLAGAYYGYQGIPIKWLRKIAWHDKIVDMVKRLLKI